MVYADLLNVERLRTSLMTSTDVQSMTYISDVARFVAAFYLGLPLFDPGNSHLPTLFIWTQLGKQNLPGASLSREDVVISLPSTFTATLPVVLLVQMGFELEAVLYSDHFDDKRSIILLRVLVDDQMKTNLTDEFIADLVISAEVHQIQMLLPGLVELDVILGRNYVRSMEIHLIDQLEILYSQLPFQTEGLKKSRPPIYLTQTENSEESEILSIMHIHINILLSAMQQTHRLKIELNRTMQVFDDSEATGEACHSILTRVTIVVLSLIYRDLFSIAATEQWSDLPEIAMKYKSLLITDEEVELNPFMRWKSLANDQDVGHLKLFLQFSKESFNETTNLPPLGAFSREVWMNKLINKETDSPNDWLSGVIQVTRQVDRELLNRLRFIAGSWKGFGISDSSLIAIRLNLSPSHFCRPAPKQVQEKRPASARESSPSSLSDRLFIPRNELIKAYAEKGKEMMAVQRATERKTFPDQRRPRYMKSSLLLKNLLTAQNELRRELEKEEEFLASESTSTSKSLLSQTERVPKERKHFIGIQKKSAINPATREELRDLWNETIQKDLLKLNEKLDMIGRQLKSPEESFFEKVERKMARQEDFIEGIFVPSEDTSKRTSRIDGFDYNEAPVAEGTPEIEKLDFSILSPPPSIGRRVSTPLDDLLYLPPPIPSTITSSSATENTEKTPISTATWAHLIPLQTQSERILRLPNHASFTDRGVQTKLEPSVTLMDMKRLSRKDIAHLVAEQPSY